MFFEIENTPEHIKRARKKDIVKNTSPKEECPRLTLAPFSRPPQVVFDNVLIGTTCERNLEILNPLKTYQQITLGKCLPPDLVVQLPGAYLELEPETCYCVTLLWTPTKPTALRETIRFTNDNRGRFDVIVVLKSVMNVKVKNNKPKFKVSPGKIKKKSGKRSPVAISKKKMETVYNTTTIKKTVNTIQTTHYKAYSMDKENMTYNSSADVNLKKCPFDSQSSIGFDFNTSEIFSNMQRNKTNFLHHTYDKSYEDNIENFTNKDNILKPSNKQVFKSQEPDVFDNLTFTPLKSLPSKNDKLDKGPRIILSVNSESDFNDSLDIQSGAKENETHSIVCITSSQLPNKWLTVNHQTQYINNNECIDTPTLPNKKIPNTSSPKEFSTPNFSINTEFSHISDLSFFPQRFSTERKVMTKINNDTQDIDDSNVMKLSSDTYTKESPNIPVDLYPNHMFVDTRQIPSNSIDPHPKICRQALFKEYYQRESEKNYFARPENYPWHNDFRVDAKSPPRSITPPLQSIPEESVQFSDAHILDKSNKQMETFMINQTFEKSDKSSICSKRQTEWSKKAVRAEPELWKIPAPLPRKSIRPKVTNKGKESITSTANLTFDSKKNINQNISLNHMGNIYSQSFTVDPFLSSTYFYDEEAVDKFEIEFKRWLNYILTPPADLDSNVEQKIDVGKAWIDNRNKEVPAAPTKEQVCIAYHNSHRLESLRRTARALLLSPEMSQVFMKLNLQIDKKLIAIRSDRNLHLDIGLQKIIMEILLSYNPLWLRLGLEAIYGLVLPLKSNSDVEGLTTFIIHRLFKNPHLKNKHSKSSAPNMLLPAYMEAIKKFTLKKFFMLVFFLDQAKQKKIIPHDPCLFCRNAICKESREIILRFTRELIAGIGDITKHLRPLGYVVSHKQSYLDEYKYAVHNIAIDIRDGVRLTKVMEIILMKNGLMTQLRTPAISRFQKKHNVQVALNALKDADFVIVGDISAVDIADGHREKTLSLLWQLIHVFRAPLFEKAANVIQMWWKIKYQVIAKKRREEQKVITQRNNAASIIQFWWRRIQYNRLVEYKMYQVTTATIVIQKYCRMWICRSRLRKFKKSAIKIAEWYRNMKMIQKSKEILQTLRFERQELEMKSATVIQVYVRRWLCIKHYDMVRKKIIFIQSIVRRYLLQKWYRNLQKAALFIQLKYRSKLKMRKEMQAYAKKRQSAIIIQSYYRMVKQRRYYKALKKSVQSIENHYRALLLMKKDSTNYLKLRHAVIMVQSMFKCKKTREAYTKKRNSIINIQRRFRANQAMKKERCNFFKLKNSSVIIQRHWKSYLTTRETRVKYLNLKSAAIKIQEFYRFYIIMKAQKEEYTSLKKSAIVIQRNYRNILLMRLERNSYLKLKRSAVVVQRRFRALILMKENKQNYQDLRRSTILIQNRYKSLLQMREERSKYLRIKSACILIQNAYRAYVLGKNQRLEYLKQKEATKKIQKWYRCLKRGNEVKQQYELIKTSCAVIQKALRAYILSKMQRQQYLRIRTATICIQKYYRNYLLTKTIRREFIQIKTSTITIQRFYRSYIVTKILRQAYLTKKYAANVIQNYYRRYLETKKIRQEYYQLKVTTIFIQKTYRSILEMRRSRAAYLRLKHSTIFLQRRFRALLAMKKERQAYLKKRSVTLYIQNRLRANCLMKVERKKFLLILESCKKIQQFYRAYRIGILQRKQFILLRQSAIILQQRYKATILMQRDRQSYMKIRSAVIAIQARYRARRLMLHDRCKFKTILKSCITIQRIYRAYYVGRKVKEDFVKLKSAAIKIQKRYRETLESRKKRNEYVRLKNVTILIQRRVKAKNVARALARKIAAETIQNWYIYILRRNECRSHFLRVKEKITIIQSIIRMQITRRRFLAIRTAAITIQRYYRSYKLAKTERKSYEQLRFSVIKLQAFVRCFIQRKRYLRLRSQVLVIQAIYRFNRQRQIIKRQRKEAAICIQKNIRRFIAVSFYKRCRKQIIYVQKLWKGKLLTRLIHKEFMQKKIIITRLQAVIRGHLVRKSVENKRENLRKFKEEQRQNWAASKIQALFRGHMVRIASDVRAGEIRRRWREGGLHSTQASLKTLNENALEVLGNRPDIEAMIRAFKSIELITEVYPMLCNTDASSVAELVCAYMCGTNRSISSIEVLKSTASILVNLTRYKITGPKVYARDRISPVLKFMWRFSNREAQLFCILTTYLWLFAKYEDIRKDLTDFLHIPENHKVLMSIKGNVMRMKRMANNVRCKFNTPQPSKFISHTMNQSLREMNHSICSNSGYVLPALEPDYGIVRANKPRYFADAEHAICCLFETYGL